MAGTPVWVVNAHFPDGTVERVTVHEEPKEGATFLARGQEWRITAVRMPKRDDERLEVVYDADVELVDSGEASGQNPDPSI